MRNLVLLTANALEFFGHMLVARGCSHIPVLQGLNDSFVSCGGLQEIPCGGLQEIQYSILGPIMLDKPCPSSVADRCFICSSALQEKREEAEPVMLEALELEVDKDAFHPDTVVPAD